MGREDGCIAATLKVSMSYEDLLARAAQAHGIELRYTDTWGRAHETSPEVLRALLASLGFSAGSGEEIERGLAAREAAEWRQPIDPTLVVREDSDHLRVRIPASRNGASVKLEIEWENGDLEHHWFWMPELETLETASVEGNEWLAKRVPLPRPLRLGYHRVRLLWMQEPELETFAEARFHRLSFAGEGRGSACGGAGVEPVRVAVGPQLGVRRLYGFARGDRCLRPGRRRVCGAESAARDRQSPAV